MANNFKVHISGRRINCLHLKVYGDFDGTSAYRLFHFIESNTLSTDKVSINTDGLRAVHPFGTELFNSHLRNGKLDIEFSGRYKNLLSYE